eukprot:scaffold116885_cov21-Tisochrysis_lutea.AAC.1
MIVCVVKAHTSRHNTTVCQGNMRAVHEEGGRNDFRHRELQAIIRLRHAATKSALVSCANIVDSEITSVSLCFTILHSKCSPCCCSRRLGEQRLRSCSPLDDDTGACMMEEMGYTRSSPPAYGGADGI